MRKQSLFVKLYLAAVLVFFAPMGVNAQVTIGSSNPPSEFSLLYLDASEQRRALHNARLTTAQRDALVTPASGQTAQNLAMGLMIYNTDTQCLEFWSGSQWVSLCVGETPDPCAGWPDTPIDNVFCSNLNPTIGDLNARFREAGGRGTIQWFASPHSTTQLPVSHILQGTQYYAANCAGRNYRVPFLILLRDCRTIFPSGYLVTYTRVMYDFQQQRLLVVGCQHDPQVASFQWQVSLDGGNAWQNIAGANSAHFDIEPYFMYSDYTDVVESNNGIDNPVDFGIRQISFRRINNRVAGAPVATFLHMYFIRTNSPGFGETATGVRYLELNRGASGTIRMALLNLGTTNDNSFGYLFQWGRRADDHQITDWVINPTAIPGVQQTPAGAIIPGPNLSSPVVRGASPPAADGDGQVNAPAFVGNFIIQATNWGADITDLWGNASNARTTAPANLAGWTQRARNNNPCTYFLGGDWRVPSRFDWADTNNGSDLALAWGAHHNTWTWIPHAVGTHPHFLSPGGAIVTNRNGESLFLPTTGHRSENTGAIGNIAVAGAYWSSTFVSGGATNNAFGMHFTVGSVGMQSVVRGMGRAVRCVW